MLVKNDHECGYIGERSGPCKEAASEGSHYCFWHDIKADKSGDNVRVLLEERAHKGPPMEGFCLKGANLDNLDLVSPEGKAYQLINSDLSRCSLVRAHLYRADLSGNNLLKADLSRANLHRTSLIGANLLGVNFKAARIEHVNFGDAFLQEEKARQERQNGDELKARELFEEAEEVARNIRKHCEAQGLFHNAGEFFHREMTFHRYRFPCLSWHRMVSKVVDLLSGYGEKPERVVLFSASFIVFCSLFYFFLGIEDGDVPVHYQAGQPFYNNLINWLETLYFSVVTFTTLGYGDLTPIGLSRLVAAIEAFIGSFTLALFVVVFVKKMTR
ncbi:pentapeptide repeat-containing protein [Endozoicomonas numazuensis]|uniref:pentapeptide repeat-containing protein n=1 Tax=Endozoicomonas numazuensis TaxID=1137799 RepID=UPI0009DCAB58|nr:pentapeptide repeat-containing protein [Endozoicomonas numazuensis]